jgi:hypothetical protein
MRFVHEVVGDVSYRVDDTWGLEFDGFHNALEGGAAGHFADLSVIDYIVEVVYECGVTALVEQTGVDTRVHGRSVAVLYKEHERMSLSEMERFLGHPPPRNDPPSIMASQSANATAAIKHSHKMNWSGS